MVNDNLATMDPKNFTMAQLKAELERRGLPMSGTKKDLIARLQREDPSGGWVDDVAQAETSDTIPKKTDED
ncbi:hypothetical protein RF55_12683 [Lasius niger]|uniref:SAP domain-containing protein n=1 Tax=Lasius niger TaxID=67767 RepID=A0A0J7KCE9_LASNI|nr:hypothetical protein RF55_12683 [Lasius niger]